MVDLPAACSQRHMPLTGSHRDNLLLLCVHGICSTIWDQADFFWPRAAVAAAVLATHQAGTTASTQLVDEKYPPDASEGAEEPQRQYQDRQYQDRRPDGDHNPQPQHPGDPPIHHRPRHNHKQGEGGPTDDDTHGDSRSRARQEHEDDSSYVEETHSPYYPAEGPSYCNNRYDGPNDSDDPSSGYGSRGWPDCLGTCFAGKCQLDQSMPGCCHLSRAHGRSYASAAAVGSSGNSSGGSVGDAHTATNNADGVSSSNLAGFSYKKEGDSDLVCWRDAV